MSGQHAGHADGQGHEHLRYCAAGAEPEVFAATAELTFPSPLEPDQAQAAVHAFLGRLCPALAAAGCALVGHIKGVVANGADELEFSLTTLAGEPRFAGGLAGPSRRATITVNVIVFGVDGRALPGLVSGAWPEDRASAAWRAHER